MCDFVWVSRGMGGMKFCLKTLSVPVSMSSMCVGAKWFDLPRVAVSDFASFRFIMWWLALSLCMCGLGRWSDAHFVSLIMATCHPFTKQRLAMNRTTERAFVKWSACCLVVSTL